MHELVEMGAFFTLYRFYIYFRKYIVKMDAAPWQIALETYP